MEVNFVLNYGRVSSIGIVEALHRADCGPVLHIHKANVRQIASELLGYLGAGKRVPQDLLWAAAASSIRDSNALINVICPIREPLTRDISALTFGQADLTAYLEGPDFINDFFARNASFATDWILNHLMPFTGIDIFSTKFDPERGYQCFSKNNVRLLIVQAELANEKKAQALETFLHLDATPLIQDKVNSSGYPSEQLKAAGRRLVENGNALIKTDRILTTHFYTENQVQLAVNRLGIEIEEIALPLHFRSSSEPTA